MVITIIILLTIACLAKWFWKEHKEDKWVKKPLQFLVFGGIILYLIIKGWWTVLGIGVIIIIWGIWRDI